MRSLALAFWVILGLSTLARAQATAAPEGQAVGTASSARADGDVRGLSWFEVYSWGPMFRKVDDHFIARLEKTSKPKLRYLMRYCAYWAQEGYVTKLKDKWKKVAGECQRILGAQAH